VHDAIDAVVAAIEQVIVIGREIIALFHEGRFTRSASRRLFPAGEPLSPSAVLEKA